tara:strand:+ start:1113 stop:1910 length:798 start_codon:yes stop_codon:yes gene_type:complete
MKHNGNIIKMSTVLNESVKYILSLGDDKIIMNDLIGKIISFKWTGKIICISCGNNINKSFAQGFCYPCFLKVPQTSECILRPELCQAHEGIARDMDWARQHCLQDHFVYLAISSGLKVGVTRSEQIPTRWIDQGAWKAIRLSKTPNRYIAGLIEVALKAHVSDRTQWQRMLKNQLIDGVDLLVEKNKMLNHLPDELKIYVSKRDDITEINYPVNDYPDKVKSLSFDKINEIKGKLWGIKGQYLIFDNGNVLNIRKHNGYGITLEI